jgi:hypothetical protein
VSHNIRGQILWNMIGIAMLVILLQPAGAQAAQLGQSNQDPVENQVLGLEHIIIAGTPILATGVISEGVEAGCIILECEDEEYLLLSENIPSIGTKVLVAGVTRPDILSYCMQGTPLAVIFIIPLEPLTAV